MHRDQDTSTYAEGNANHADACSHVLSRADNQRLLGAGPATSGANRGAKRAVSVRLDELLWRAHRARWWAWRLFGCVLVTVCSTAARLWAAGL